MQALALLLMVSAALAHNWLETPPSRDATLVGGSWVNTAAQTTPCDVSASGNTPPITNVTVGTSLAATWSTNTGAGHTGDHYLYLLPLGQLGQIETNKNVAVWNGNFPITTGQTSIPIPTSLTLGRYVLQYVWNSYRNCADLQVLGAVPAGATISTPNNYNLAGGTGTYNTQTGTFSCTNGYSVVANSACAPSGSTASGTSGEYNLPGGGGVFLAVSGIISCNPGCSVSGMTCSCGAADDGVSGITELGTTPGGKAGIAFAVLFMVAAIAGVVFLVIKRKPSAPGRFQEMMQDGEAADGYYAAPPMEPRTAG